MALRILLATVFLSTALSQTTTLQIPFYGYDTFPIDASVIGVQDSMTTMSLACPSSADSNDCGLFPQQTLTYGPSTYRMEMGTGDAEFTGSQICVASVCTESAGGSGANDPGSSTTTYDDVETMPVTVTAGAALLGSASGGAGATTASGNQSGSIASMTSSGTTQTTGSGSMSASDSASRTQSAAAETSSSAASASIMVRGGTMGGLAALVALLL